MTHVITHNWFTDHSLMSDDYHDWLLSWVWLWVWVSVGISHSLTEASDCDGESVIECDCECEWLKLSWLIVWLIGWVLFDLWLWRVWVWLTLSVTHSLTACVSVWVCVLTVCVVKLPISYGTYTALILLWQISLTTDVTDLVLLFMLSSTTSTTLDYQPTSTICLASDESKQTVKQGVIESSS